MVISSRFPQAAAAALCLFQGTAGATVLDFDFRGAGTGSAGPSLTFTQGGVTLEVTASDTSGAVRDLWRFDQAGLGVTEGTGANTAGTGESLTFDLSPLEVSLGIALVLDVTSGTQTFDLLVDGVFQSTFSLTGGPGGTNPPDINAVDLSPFAVGGSSFQIVAGEGPGLTVAALEVLTHQVPAPAPLLLVCTGVAAFGVSRRLRG
jgi:hypothetical protein